MNAQRKNSAVKKYTAEKVAGKSKEEVLQLINDDEKQYTSEEAVEILEAVFSEELADKKPTKKASKSDVVHYQEWDVEITGGKAEKLKISRPVVKITEEEANMLNHGVEKGGNTHAKMYFLPE